MIVFNLPEVAPVRHGAVLLDVRLLVEGPGDDGVRGAEDGGASPASEVGLRGGSVHQHFIHGEAVLSITFIVNGSLFTLLS